MSRQFYEILECASFLSANYGRGIGVGRGLIVGASLGVGVGLGVAVTVGVAVAVGVTVGVDVAVGVAVGVGEGVPCVHMKISSEDSITPLLAYPPESQMRSVPLVSVEKARRAVENGDPVVQQQMSTSVDGLGATRPPPITNISPLKLKARVSPVARGMAGMPPMVLRTGSKLNELVVSTIVPPW